MLVRMKACLYLLLAALAGFVPARAAPEQIGRAGLAQRPNLVPQFGQGQGSIQRGVQAGLFPLVEPVARGALRVGIGEDNRAVPGVFGGGGEVNGDGRFTGTAFLIGHHNRFHKNENTIILPFMKDGKSWRSWSVMIRRMASAGAGVTQPRAPPRWRSSLAGGFPDMLRCTKRTRYP